MTEFELINFNNHFLFSSNGQIILLDTGAPSTVSNEKQLLLLDKNNAVLQQYLGVTVETLSEHVGTKIDVLLGADILSHYSVSISLKTGKIVFSENNDNQEGDTFPFELFMGIPVISFLLNGTSYKGFLDTGAPLSYLKANMTRNLPINGRQTDFYVGYGQFITTTYAGVVQISKQSFPAKFGCLPLVLETMLMMAGVSGIIGFDFFNSFDVLIDYKNKKITVC
ncbi:MAG: hypothetical protein LBR10_05895 [Prevotellaceae bacterium]|jgi:hypothetical protein|nr:hypothetical protein [Prevotellaceae bacterium]